MNLIYIALANGLNSGFGGALVRSVNVAKNLQKKGHQISFITTRAGRKACESIGLKTNYIIIPAWFGKEPREERGRLDRLISNLASTYYAIKYANFQLFHQRRTSLGLATFNSQLSTLNFRLIYSDSDYFCDVIPAAYLKRRLKCQWVAMIHHKISLDKKNFSTFFTSFYSVISQLFSFLIIKSFANAIFVYDSPMGKHVAEYFSRRSCRDGTRPVSVKKKRGERKSSIFRIKNGVDLNFIKSVEPHHKKHTACMIAGLRPSKGMYDIIPIWKEVVKEIPQATLVVIGAGLKEYENWLIKKVKDHDLEGRLFFLGAQHRDQAIAYLKSSSIFFFPSHEEGWGIAIMEALACRKPVVAYNLDVYRDVFGNTIITAPMFDTYAFAKKTIAAIKSGRDPNFTFVKKGFELAKNNSWDEIAHHEEKLFIAITGSNTRPDSS